MNRQVNYIIYAMLLSLSLPVGYYFIEKIISTEKNSPPEPVISEKKIEIPAPGKSVLAGKILFMSKCAACHSIFKAMTGPGLLGFEDRGPWHDRNNLYEWIKNPSRFMEKDLYTQNLKKETGSMMQGFPDMTNEEIDAIADFLNYASQYGRIPGGATD